MSYIKNMPASGLVVIMVILALFVVSVIVLLHLNVRYRFLTHRASGSPDNAPPFLRFAVAEYSAAFERFGEDVNTPAIIADSFSTKLGGLLLCERFLNNAVSLFVTLGLFGTFLGLSLSVASLTELISYSNTTEWLSVLDSVGGGLVSALSGMGVAFYTSLVGVACSIVLTVLKAILNPESLRAKLETRMELWLDHSVASNLKTSAPKRDVDLVRMLVAGLNESAAKVEKSLGDATTALIHTSDAFNRQLGSFDASVGKFNDSVRSFNEVDYNLRGTVERLDVDVRDFSAAMRALNNRLGGGKN